MKIAPLPTNEQARLAELKKYGILDTEPEIPFDRIVQLAAYICNTPIAAISLVDEERQWFKAIAGLDAKETSRDVAFCAHAILQDEPMIVPNALLDERFSDNPLVTSTPDIRFYAGVPLKTSAGQNIGTLCVIDREPRELSQAQIDAIAALSDNVMAHLELRLSHKNIRQYTEDLQLAASIFSNASEAMLVTDPDNKIITINPAFTEITGYALEEVVGKNPSILSSGKQDDAFYRAMWQALNQTGHWNGELWNKRKSGEVYAEALSINVIFHDDGSKRMYVAIFSDITEKKQADETIWKHANYDQLTQLPNRRLFYDRLAHELKMAHRFKRTLAMFFIDIDYFKNINDSFGHDIGDLLLMQAAERLSQSVRESDTVARMSGDEFTVILPQIDSVDDAAQVANTIVKAFNAPFQLKAHTMNVSVSIGLALYPANADNMDDLLKNADQAMYQAKQQGRGRFCVFTA